MLTTADWLIIAVVLVSGGLSLFRGFLKEAVSLIAWGGALIVASKFYEPLSHKLTFISNDITRKAVAGIALYVVTLLVVGLCGSILRSLVQKVDLTGTDRLLGMVFGILRGLLIVCVVLVLMQIGFKLHILSFVADSPFYRDSVFIPEIQRIVNWFFENGPQISNQLDLKVGA